MHVFTVLIISGVSHLISNEVGGPNKFNKLKDFEMTQEGRQ